MDRIPKQPDEPITTPPTVPTKPGLWWRNDTAEPVKIDKGVLCRLQWWRDSHLREVQNDGHWLCPCLTPAEQRERLETLVAKLEADTEAHGGESMIGGEYHGIELAATALGITLEGREG